MKNIEKQLICSDLIREIKLYFYDNIYDEKLENCGKPKMIPFKTVLSIISKYGEMSNDC